ncbi:MAG: NADH-quinone oxidoreductase subunit N [Chitinophagaceae bacterium]|nr:NADH-quinone oxidoreductase subunit N [Chitinophagaceae bacterium]
MMVLIILTAAGILAMFASVFNGRSVVLPVSLSGLFAAGYFALLEWNTNTTYFEAMRMDNFAIAFTVVCLFAAFVFLLLYHYMHYSSDVHYAEVISIILFSLAGVVVMVSFTSMLMLFLGIEILSLSLYILAGLKKKDLLSNEASLKYLLMGAFATGFLLFGIAMLYGATGSFMLSDIAYYLGLHKAVAEPFIVTGIIMLMIGLLFKVAAAPFHFWTPDVYQGAPTLVTGYMATVGKVAAFAALVRVFQLGFSPALETYQFLFAAVAVTTMFIGNITALYQKSVKRMLAYSSISHAGYMLIALMAANEVTNGAVLFYSIAYTLASLLAFAVVAILQQKSGSDEVSVFNGLSKSSPLMSITFAVAMLSLAGIPPTAGFFAKFYVFSAAISDGWVWITVLAIINSFISVYYYFAPVIASYMKKGNEEGIVLATPVKVLLAIIALLTLLIGLLPGSLSYLI